MVFGETAAVKGCLDIIIQQFSGSANAHITLGFSRWYYGTCSVFCRPFHYIFGETGRGIMDFLRGHETAVDEKLDSNLILHKTSDMQAGINLLGIIDEEDAVSLMLILLCHAKCNNISLR